VNLFEMLCRDHQELDSLLSRLVRAPGSAGFDEEGRKYLLDRLVLVASRHEAAEELVLWPQVRRRLDGGKELADKALRAENDAKALLEALPTISAEQELAKGCAELHAVLFEHARFEEDIVFPELRRHTTRMWATVGGQKFRLARRGGPTRPHANGPDRPFGLMTRGAPAMVTDHLRDLGNHARRSPIGFEEPGREDAVKVIMDDHARIGALMNQIEPLDDPGDDLVHAFIRELSIHDSIERQHLYPAIPLRVQDGYRIYQQQLNDHGRMGEQAHRIDKYDFHDEARTGWLRELIVHVRTHIEQEEGSVLPALRARLTPEELVDLGSRLQSAREKAPTRPHPRLAGAGTGARLLRLATTPVDRAKDVLAGRRGG
jgi:hemerythrin superfamily protein